MKRLLAYSWPGNVREMQNVLKRIMILGDSEENLDDLLKGSDIHAYSGNSNPGNFETLVSSELLNLDNSSDSNLNSLSLKKVRKRVLDRVEKEVIAYVLSKTGWNRSKATKILKISYKTLLYKIKDLGIRPPDSAKIDQEF
jgi:DNA-binding NtrC family response regulator